MLLSCRWCNRQWIRTIMSNTRTAIKPAVSYEAAINALNNLQSNADYIKKAEVRTARVGNLTEVQKYLERSGLALNKLDELSVIHVTGTKGKGTTCAFTESILRHHGFKTGFYSSPHLLDVRERIRIDGKPISKDVFAEFFWKIYGILDSKKSYPEDMPLYFRFLTVMAFHVFLEHKVDVAVIEVGIGGEHDCTNVLRKVPVAGITSLGIDHEILLGNTVDSIAWHKAGIMKTGSKVFTVTQPTIAMKVLEERSRVRNCTLKVVNDNFPLKLKQSNRFPPHILKANANLALALCQAWMSTNVINNNATKFSMEIAKKGFENCIWLGRYQTIKSDNVTYYLDGAHTIESIEVCANWFTDQTKSSNAKKVLMFNLTGLRNSETLLRKLRFCEFHEALFVPNIATAVNNNPEKQLIRCTEHQQLWIKMDKEENSIPETTSVQVFDTIQAAINSLKSKNGNFDVLVTGSIHLVGCMLSLLDPDLDNTMNGE